MNPEHTTEITVPKYISGFDVLPDDIIFMMTEIIIGSGIVTEGPIMKIRG